MARGINDIGIGQGYIYVTNQAVTSMVAIRDNTQQGYRDIRNMALKNAPLAANRSAVATIQVTGAAAIGSLTSITIAGINQIAGPVPCTSASTPVVAQTWVDAINAFTPPTGPDYTAAAQGDIIYVFAPESAGSSVNGLLPVISTTSGTLTATATAFIGGSLNTGILEDTIGYKYWLDANYGPTGIVGSVIALPNPALPFLYALEITNYVTRRGLETGIYTEEQFISFDTLVVVRKSGITNYLISNSGGAAADYLVRITTNDFIEGDLLILSNGNQGQVTTVASPPTAESVSTTANPNIFLTRYSDWVSDPLSVILLQFHYDDVFGGIFREIGRSNPQTLTVIQHNQSVWADPLYGNNATAVRNDFISVNQTPDGAILLALAGDTLTFRPGTHNFSSQQLLGKANLTIVTQAGALINGSNSFLSNIQPGCSIVGSGKIVHAGSISASQTDCSIECNYLEMDQWDLAGDNVKLNVKDELVCHGYIRFNSGSHNSYLTWKKATFNNSLGYSGGVCVALGDGTAGSKAFVKGDIYVSGGNFDSILRGALTSGSLVYTPRWEGRIFIDPSATMIYVIRSYTNQNASIISPNRLRVKGEIHCPISTYIIHTLGGGEMEFIGKIFSSNQGSRAVVTSDTDASIRNLPSKVHLTDCDIYTDTTGNALQINDIGFTVARSRIIGKNLSVIAPSAAAWINCDVAGGLYQCKGIWANRPTGANASNELTPQQDVQVNTLMM